MIGHWRSGTTLLHELLVLDSRHTYADTYDCFAPNHFLVSSWLIRPTLGLLMPARRPVDNMAAGWDHPQEDEFALCNMGVPSPYLTAAFPNCPSQYPEYLDLRDVPPAAVQRWKDSLRWFLTCLTVRRPKRIVLKSPAHTCRIKVLLEMFPNAKFVHIVPRSIRDLPVHDQSMEASVPRRGFADADVRRAGRIRFSHAQPNVRRLRAGPAAARTRPVV